MTFIQLPRLFLLRFLLESHLYFLPIPFPWFFWRFCLLDPILMPCILPDKLTPTVLTTICIWWCLPNISLSHAYFLSFKPIYLAALWMSQLQFPQKQCSWTGLLFFPFTTSLPVFPISINVNVIQLYICPIFGSHPELLFLILQLNYSTISEHLLCVRHCINTGDTADYENENTNNHSLTPVGFSQNIYKSILPVKSWKSFEHICTVWNQDYNSWNYICFHKKENTWKIENSYVVC